ncbi:MAG: c-type cytochrome [Puniceicoccaceae bacterium]
MNSDGQPHSKTSLKHPSGNPKNESANFTDDSLRAVHDQLAREKKEPSELAAPLPISVVFLCCAVIAWAAFYFGSRYNKFSWEVTNPYFDPMAASAPPPAFDPIAVGRRIYAQNCIQCHQADGNGTAAFPPLNRSEWVRGEPGRVASILLHGLVGEIEVAGKKYNGNMPAFGANLNDQRIAAVITYIRQEWDNTYSEVTEEMVAAERARSASRTSPWTGPDLLAIFPIE